MHPFIRRRLSAENAYLQKFSSCLVLPMGSLLFAFYNKFRNLWSSPPLVVKRSPSLSSLYKDYGISRSHSPSLVFPAKSSYDHWFLIVAARIEIIGANYQTFIIWAGGGRKGGPKTAKPHRNTPKNRKPHWTFSLIPKPYIQGGPLYESWRHQDLGSLLLLLPTSLFLL